MPRGRDAESLRTILVAAGANLVIAFAKIAAALITTSAALWAEAAHSVADTGNELLLLVGLRRSSRRRDRRHPLGHGRERFFWALLASFGIFVVGGVLSIAEGVRSLLNPEPLDNPWIGIAVLVVAGIFEGSSWMVARRQLVEAAQRRRRTIFQHLRRASDPSAPTVYLEDSAALIGVGLALAALVLHLTTGWPYWDGIASICIGLLLITIAVLLARRSKALLLDEQAPPDVLAPIAEIIRAVEWVNRIERLDAVYIGPARLLVLAHVVPEPNATYGPALGILQLVEDLRRRLISEDAIGEAAVTVRYERPE